MSPMGWSGINQVLYCNFCLSVMLDGLPSISFLINKRWEQLTGFNTGFEIRVFLLLDGLHSRVNELHLPKVLVLRRQDLAFAPSHVRQNSYTTGRSGVGLWLSEAIFYACSKEHLPDTGRLNPVSPLGITLPDTGRLNPAPWLVPTVVMPRGDTGFKRPVSGKCSLLHA
jgi:hypothetical protein